MKMYLLAALILALSACSSKIDGTFADQVGMTSYTFKSGGKAYVSVMGTEVEVDYVVDGNKIKLTTPQGNMILTALDDGSLQGPMGVKLTRKKG